MRAQILNLLSVLLVTLSFSTAVSAQTSANTMAPETAKVIVLEQTEGAFTLSSLTISEGDYQFEIQNNGVDREVGFVLAPEGKTDAEHHIKAAYVKETVKNGKSSLTNIVSLKKGTYEYFCPLNPTPHYTLIVE